MLGNRRFSSHIFSFRTSLRMHLSMVAHEPPM